MENDQSELQLPLDRISILPDNVKNIILCCLPTRDAVRTSMLSKNWRNVWTKIPKFVLDQTFWENVSKQHSAEIMLTKILFQLLLFHDGPINEFVLSNPDLNSCPEIDSLIDFLAKRDLKDFELEMWKDCYLLPHSFFSCQKLSRLILNSCSIRSSPAYDGFSVLTTLKLLEVTICAETLESLISGSPLLDYLEIESCSEVDICIDAPNLKTFDFYGFTKLINFKSVPALADISIQKNESEGTINFVGVGCDSVKFFLLFPVIESLSLNSDCVQDFEGILQRRLPAPLIYLKKLSPYNISFNDSSELSFTLCLLRSSPNLKFINIEFKDESDSNSEETTTLMEGGDYSDIYLNELIQVKLEGVAGTKPELEFAKILLAKSSSLKKIEIQPKQCLIDNGFKIVKEVLKFRRISKEAEVVFEE